MTHKTFFSLRCGFGSRIALSLLAMCALVVLSGLGVAHGLATNETPAVVVLTNNQPNWFIRGSVASGTNALLCFDGSFWYTIDQMNTAYSAPAAAVRSTGEVDVVVQGPNGTLRYYWGSGCSHPWSEYTLSPSVPIASAPAIAVRPTGEADITAINKNQQLVYFWAFPGGLWNSATVDTAAMATLRPAIVVQSNQEADIFVTRTDNSLVYYSATPGNPWSKAQILPSGKAFSAPAVIGHALDVVVQGPNEQLWEYTYVPLLKTWTSLEIAGSNSTTSAPAAVLRANGEYDVVAQGQGNALWYYYHFPNSLRWNSYQIPQVTTNVGPAVAVDGNSKWVYVSYVDSTGAGNCQATPGSFFFCFTLVNHMEQ